MSIALTALSPNLSPRKCTSCPNFERRNTLIAKAVDDLISSGIINLIIHNNTHLYCGKVIQPDRIEQLAQDKGHTVFRSYVYVQHHENIPPGTEYLQLTIKKPILIGFNGL